MRAQKIPDIALEFAGAELGDERLTKRLQRIAASVAVAPGDSFPRLAGSDGELEGVYRFFGNARVSLESILEPHRRATRIRSSTDDILVLHDTTGFSFRGSSPREGLGRLQRSGRLQSRQGFFGHFALAICADESRQPLGLLGLRTFVRAEQQKGPKTGRPRSYRERKEASRWAALALDVHSTTSNAIHVMDREADSYENYRLLLDASARFIIRGRIGWNRVGERNGVRDTLSELTARTPIRLRRDVRISRRKPNAVSVLNKANPPRAERTARLSVRAARVLLPRPHVFSRRDPDRDSLPLNVVYVEETSPPHGVEPISWMLLTNEPIETCEQVEKVVDAYRARWTIEEFFKALKTGCAFEKRQLESLDALRNALAVFSVVAYRLLLLRSVSRLTPQAPGTTVASRRQIELLRTIPQLDRRFADIAVSAHATTSDILLAIAKLGGHLKNNGPPGWQVIGRGYDSLLLLELGWQAHEAREM
jgi:Transposase DNA-binding/Transposase DDE domain